MQAPDFAAPLEVTLLLGDRTLVVKPASVGQIARLLTVAAPVVNTLMTLPPQLLDALRAEGGPGVPEVAELFELLSRHPSKLIEMVAIATELDLAEVSAMPPDRFTFLFAVVVQVNADFFFRATPAFAAAGRVLQQLKDRAPATPGPAPSIG
jgi:hypothetical protein